MSLNSLTVAKLRELKEEYGLAEPKGSGEKGKVVKGDLVKLIADYEAENEIVRKGAKKAAAGGEKAEKAPAKGKSATAGLKTGNRVLYVEDGKYNFEAIVTGRVVSTKAMITPVVDVDDTYNTRKEVDVFRKHITIIGEGEAINNIVVDANHVKITFKGTGKPTTLDVEGVDADVLINAFIEMLDNSEIKYARK